MRRIAITALTAALLMGLTACGDNEPSPTASTPGPSTSAEREGRYIFASEDLDFTSRRPSNEELLAYPPQWCAALAAGHSVEWLFDPAGGDLYPWGEDWGTKEADADELLVLGIKIYCPQHLNTVTKELREGGDY